MVANDDAPTKSEEMPARDPEREALKRRMVLGCRALVMYLLVFAILLSTLAAELGTVKLNASHESIVGERGSTHNSFRCIRHNCPISCPLLNHQVTSIGREHLKPNRSTTHGDGSKGESRILATQAMI